jgi:hypothetical protein
MLRDHGDSRVRSNLAEDTPRDPRSRTQPGNCPETRTQKKPQLLLTSRAVHICCRYPHTRLNLTAKRLSNSVFCAILLLISSRRASF